MFPGRGTQRGRCRGEESDASYSGGIGRDLVRGRGPARHPEGDWVTILAEGGSVRVSAPGRLGKRGAPGETIRVANRASKRTVQAKVVDSKTVRVEW